MLMLPLVLNGCSMESFSDAARPATPVRSPITQDAELPPPSELAEVVERALPSVVNVKVQSLRLSEQAPPTQGQGEGSGVIIDESGVILTNYHVVEGAVQVRVVFNDDREPLEGEVIGGDPDKDLAVIQVDADDLEAAPIGDSSALRLGDGVVAIGFPLGLGGPTVTSGILSGTDREIEAQAAYGPESLQGLLQTDAAINPGNSGGALMDMGGRLVGINTAVAGSAENVGFAIPIDAALPIVNEILTEPPETRAWLGVQLATVDSPAIADELGIPFDVHGAAVTVVIPDGPAERAGLTAGDVITQLDGEPIPSSEELIAALTEIDPGQQIELRLVSAAGSRTVEVTLAPRPATFEPRENEEDE